MFRSSNGQEPFLASQDPATINILNSHFYLSAYRFSVSSSPSLLHRSQLFLHYSPHTCSFCISYLSKAYLVKDSFYRRDGVLQESVPSSMLPGHASSVAVAVGHMLSRDQFRLKFYQSPNDVSSIDIYWSTISQGTGISYAGHLFCHLMQDSVSERVLIEAWSSARTERIISWRLSIW
jgi:hypothetical protein